MPGQSERNRACEPDGPCQRNIRFGVLCWGAWEDFIVQRQFIVRRAATLASTTLGRSWPATVLAKDGDGGAGGGGDGGGGHGGGDNSGRGGGDDGGNGRGGGDGGQGRGRGGDDGG